jgi:hypothetical protein
MYLILPLGLLRITAEETHRKQKVLFGDSSTMRDVSEEIKELETKPELILKNGVGWEERGKARRDGYLTFSLSSARRTLQLASPDTIRVHSVGRAQLLATLGQRVIQHHDHA